mmetsp:Transcript_31749/g.49677  ORF Transcript_31749/g.49677 Transcript_31749/m.49677 type:complete len:594 (-) Transcript_31749:28-1809(-)|eukprot:CAMPEP_0201510118 /NCGR_PEP_ID=MMETSP0161_2-20130828/2945_1 /ASSEMBLY_ACC=CAM_ASM_000251 /TAXON_ID=180227 /ORGANISM="Neoparamoeba aestuarina, Strain SoJaBio B1-5/56/2" /LENGTH=593 /DNA_ID=CAMNT_0047905251 /DNA_START=98 /DNA_END=1879 /DNA_ORIENTATION=-
MPGAVIQQGWLHKKGGGKSLGGRANWTKRWFVLSKQKLDYYTDEKLSVLKGSVWIDDELLNYSGFKIEIERDKKHTFVMSLPNRQFEMQASNDGEMNSWIQILNETINSQKPGAKQQQQLQQQQRQQQENKRTVSQQNLGKQQSSPYLSPLPPPLCPSPRPSSPTPGLPLPAARSHSERSSDRSSSPSSWSPVVPPRSGSPSPRGNTSPAPPPSPRSAALCAQRGQTSPSLSSSMNAGNHFEKTSPTTQLRGSVGGERNSGGGERGSWGGDRGAPLASPRREPAGSLPVLPVSPRSPRGEEEKKGIYSSPPEKWSGDDVVMWLNVIGAKTAIDTFTTNLMLGIDLLELTQEEIGDDLAIEDVEMAALIWKNVNDLKNGNFRESSEKGGDDEGLADGWKEYVDGKGRTYYYNKATRQKQWNKPAAGQTNSSGAIKGAMLSWTSDEVVTYLEQLNIPAHLVGSIKQKGWGGPHLMSCTKADLAELVNGEEEAKEKIIHGVTDLLVKNGQKYVVLWSFEGNNTNKLTVSAGMTVYGIEEVDEEWIKIRDLKGGVGRVPKRYVRIVEKKDDDRPKRSLGSSRGGERGADRGRGLGQK